MGLPARALLAAAEHRQDDVTGFLTDADAHQPLVRRRAAGRPVKDLLDRPVRNALVVQPAAAPEHNRIGAHQALELQGKPGLANPGFAEQRHELPGAAHADGAERIAEQAELRLPADVLALPASLDRGGVGVDIREHNCCRVITGEGRAGRVPGPVRGMRDELPGGWCHQHLALAGRTRQGSGLLGEIPEQEWGCWARRRHHFPGGHADTERQRLVRGAPGGAARPATYQLPGSYHGVQDVVLPGVRPPEDNGEGGRLAVAHEPVVGIAYRGNPRPQAEQGGTDCLRVGLGAGPLRLVWHRDQAGEQHPAGRCPQPHGIGRRRPGGRLRQLTLAQHELMGIAQFPGRLDA